MTDDTGSSFELLAVLIVVLMIGAMAIGAYLALPRSLRRLALSQAFRLDGSYSSRRQQTERWHLLKFVGEALAGPLLVALPVLLIGFLIHQWVVPVGIATDTLAAFHWDENVWRNHVEKTARSRHESWARNQGYDQHRIDAIQRMVWSLWPVILLGFVVAAVAACIAGAKYLQRLILEYQRDLMARCQEYRMTDLSPYPRHEYSSSDE